MKILYAIQGTGNGHVSRAIEIVPLLKKLAEVDVLVSGIQSDLEVPFDVKYSFYGLSFIFGKRGGVDLWKTLLKSRPLRLLRDMRSLPVAEYDLVITDFEPVSAWACKLRKKTCIGLSHQNAVLHHSAPVPDKNNVLGKFILRNYAPSGYKYGFHFQSIDEQIFTPVIRRSIRLSELANKDHYTVYLPAYGDEEIISILGSFESVYWEVFSKHTTKEYVTGNIHFRKVSVHGFTESFLSCKGILCTGGFETPAEALFLGKKLCVVPMKNQYEQQCNAAFLKSMGITVLPQLSNCNDELAEWLNKDEIIEINYPDQTNEILEMILSRHGEEL